MPTNIRSRASWPKFFLLAPLHAFRRPPTQKLFVAEADCDRPREGYFTSKFLQPEAALWVSVSNTHSGNFDPLVTSGMFATHEAAIAHEFGYFIERASKLVIVNGDQPAMIDQLQRAQSGVQIERVSAKAISGYKLTERETIFTIAGQEIRLPGLHPRALGTSLQMVNELLEYLDVPLDPTYTKLVMPPGRTNVLAGKKGTTLIDSTYNTGLGATAAVLELFKQYPSQHKWLVLGDILEQGSLEKDEHERLAELVSKQRVERIVLLGSRNKRFTLPRLKQLVADAQIQSFEKVSEVLVYLEKELRGGEAILFKGAQGLEGVIEELLANPADAKQLVRRQPVWVKRRKAWGLPR